MKKLNEQHVVVKSGDEIIHDLPLEKFLKLPYTELTDALTLALKGFPAKLTDYCETNDISITFTDQLRADITDEERRELEMREPVGTIEIPTITNPGGIERKGILRAQFPDDPIISLEGWKYRKGDRIVFDDGEKAQIEALLQTANAYLLNREGPSPEAIALDRWDVERTSSLLS